MKNVEMLLPQAAKHLSAVLWQHAVGHIGDIWTDWGRGVVSDSFMSVLWIPAIPNDWISATVEAETCRSLR